jgi:hypothetical protein
MHQPAPCVRVRVCVAGVQVPQPSDMSEMNHDPEDTSNPEPALQVSRRPVEVSGVARLRLELGRVRRAAPRTCRCRHD